MKTAISVARMMGKPKEEKTSSTALHAHGDGTFHSESGYGNRTEHANFGEAVAHMAKRHTPMPHKNIPALKKAITQFMGEEGKEA